jgi:hypothetical protein
MLIHTEVTGTDGKLLRSMVETVNGYTYTPLAAVEAARRVLAGERRVGFQTPVTVFSASFAETIAGTRIVHLGDAQRGDTLATEW